MNNFFKTNIFSTGLAIFSMLFGAGNLIYPLKAGMISGQHFAAGFIAFSLTAVILPLLGLVSMILFDGDYYAFFGRLGRYAGGLFIFICMLVIGPVIAIPRIVTLSHSMTAPFMGTVWLSHVNPLTSFVFSILFLGVTFALTFRENKIVELVGKYISPLLLISLAIIIVKGFLSGSSIITTQESTGVIIKKNLMLGYETLDLLGTIFFCSIVLHILRNTMDIQFERNHRYRAIVGLKAGLIGVSLLAIVYVGMSLVALYHGHGLEASGQLFSMLSFKILGGHGAIIIAVAVLMACLSTSIALTAVVAEYLQQEVFKNKTSYFVGLILVCLLSIPLSTMGLDGVLGLTGGPLVYILYPMLIALTLCNIAYKLFGFNYIKLPVLATFIISLISYWL